MNHLPKLPEWGTSIFTIMSRMAAEYNALNLAQGFPDWNCDDELIDLVHHFQKKGFNQYAPMQGIQSLRKIISEKIEKLYNRHYDSEEEITITAGATQALFTAISCVVKAGDEIIVFEPAYDSYVPDILSNYGIPVYIPLLPGNYSVDWDLVRKKITSKTKAIIINTPHNPTGAIWSEQDWLQLIELIQDKNIVVLSDEVYEHLVFDGQKHYSALHFPELRERSFVIGSFGKSFHVTGWKTGYCVATPQLMQLFRQIYQFANFCGTTPCQIALANYMQHHPEHIQTLPDFYQTKRDLFNQQIQNSRFNFIPSPGTYFQSLDYSAIRPDLDDVAMCQFLAEQHKIVAIPISVFYQQAPESLRLIRFCFAKTDATLQRAGDILMQC